MVNTSSHPWTVNGVRLDTWANNIASKNGWVHVPTMRGANAQVAGRHGEIWTPTKRFEAGQVLLEMWVSHMNVDGAMVGSDKYANWRHNLDALIATFDSSFGLLDVRQQISATETRQAFCETKAISDPEMFGNLFGSLKVSLDIPGVFWQDVAYIQWTTPTGLSAVATHDLVALAGATAPMEDSQFVVDGPLTNPTIVDDRTGHYVQLQEVLPTGQQWVVDAANWTSKTGTGIEWTANGANKTSKTVNSGFFAPRLMGIAPGLVPGTAPRVRLEGTAAGAATRLRGRTWRKFK